MNRIDKLFINLRLRNKKAFIAYITAGDPDISTTKKLILELAGSGASLVELGVAFSDPLADGPTIQAASQRALSRGINLDKIFSIVRDIRKTTDIPVVLMTYYNPVFKYGIKRFVSAAKNSGVDGVIVPDLPPEEAWELIKYSRASDFSTIFMAAPTSSPERLRLIARYSTGFIYYVSLTGVTGARSVLPSDIKKQAASIRKITKKPVCIGFGISNAKQAASAASIADGVIVGSAIINIIENNSNKPGLVREVGKFIKKLCVSLD